MFLQSIDPAAFMHLPACRRAATIAGVTIATMSLQSA
jgi:hypothetical protein